MRVCMCVKCAYMRVCMFACIYVCIRCAYDNIHIRFAVTTIIVLQAYIFHEHMHTHIYASLNICMYIYLYIFLSLDWLHQRLDNPPQILKMELLISVLLLPVSGNNLYIYICVHLFIYTCCILCTRYILHTCLFI